MTMTGSAAESFLRRHQVLQLSFWIQLLFAILYAMATMDVTGQCYSEPCSSDSPTITSGLGIVTTMAAFIFICQPCYGLYLLRIQCSELVAGIFIGCSALATLGALHEAILWGSVPGLAVAIASEAGLEVNSSGVMSFKALSVLAWILFGLMSFSTWTSCTSRDVLLEVTWVPSHDYSQLPTRSRANGTKLSTYQTMDDEDLEVAAISDPDGSLAHYL